MNIGRLRGGLCVYWYDSTGKRIRRQLEARTRKDAEAEAIDVYRKENPTPAGQTVQQIWDDYLIERQGRSVATTMRYTGKAILPHFGALRPDQIDTLHCRDYTSMRRQAGRKDGSIWTELGHLRTTMQWAEKTGRIERAPAIERPQKPAPKDRYMTRAEIAKILAAPCEPHIRLAALLMLSTAGRVSAILELTWDRVDLDRGLIDLRISESTTRKGRAVVPINAGLRAALQEAREAALSDHVVEWAGGPVKSIRKGIVSLAARAGVPNISPHVFRHTSAVHMAEAGVPMSEISQYLGHSNVAITERVYARFSPDYLRKAADVVDFTMIRSVLGSKN
ncbi:tyrosine-type recombinase/integrase [Parasedimentitalea psychrophila]|uniref:tyrosine-type recombinase/integrase n=1 Tax=Parasedimentitalea psychrophila TaxID=2997337 RepID=UPI0036F28F39